MTGEPKYAHTDPAVSEPKWIPLFQGYAHVNRIVWSQPADALRQALDDGRLRHRVGCAYTGFPQRRQLINISAPAGFWRLAQVRWEEDAAVCTGSMRFEAYRVVVAERDLFILWPGDPLIFEAGTDDSSARPGAKRKYDRAEILTEASVYIYVNGLPESQSQLIDKLYEILGDKAPGDTLMKEIIGPFYKRHKAALPPK
jgi:hypothetical protein